MAAQPARATAVIARRTRDRILEASLALFNDQGLAAVSTHRIAAELEISPGNLHYHFKSKQLVVTQLYRRFDERIEACLQAAPEVEALDDLWLYLQITFEAVEAYRFVFRDAHHLLSEYPVLESRVRSLTARLLVAARQVCDGLQRSGMIEAGDEDLELLALQMVFAITSWSLFKRLVPGSGNPRHSEPSLAAYYTLSFVTPYVVGEARAYLNYLRAKYLRHQSPVPPGA